jgi:hypothetical protein
MMEQEVKSTEKVAANDIVTRGVRSMRTNPFSYLAGVVFIVLMSSAVDTIKTQQAELNTQGQQLVAANAEIANRELKIKTLTEQQEQAEKQKDIEKRELLLACELKQKLGSKPEPTKSPAENASYLAKVKSLWPW